MTIIGFNFDKISIERKGPSKGNISIKNNVSIKDIQKKDISLGKNKQEGVVFIFEFFSKYEPNVAEINLTGNVVTVLESDKAKKVVDGWKKDKKIPQDIMTQVLNTTLTKCNIQSLILSQDLNLPPPIPLPKVEASKKTDNYIG